MSYPRNVSILVFDDVEVLDFSGPYEVFNVAAASAAPPPFSVFSVGITGEAILGRGHFTFTPRYSIENCPQADILIVPGGFGTRALLRHEGLIKWISEQAEKVEWLLSVCTGALLLAKAGLLQNCTATTHHTAFELLRELSPTTVLAEDRRFVQSSAKIITSGGISAGIDLALHMVDKLVGSAVRDSVVEEMEYNWGNGRS
ncbi:MAG TPA: DJ-1/PfpI family protein [Spirochaetia bacterium]|nr:DJ-1/PfpI family protein [Spirochaetia bacterium]